MSVHVLACTLYTVLCLKKGQKGTFLVLQQQQNLGQRFGTIKMHLSPQVAKAAVRSKAVVLLLLTCCLLLLQLWESVIVLCFVVRYFASILVLQSSW